MNLQFVGLFIFVLVVVGVFVAIRILSGRDRTISSVIRSWFSHTDRDPVGMVARAIVHESRIVGKRMSPPSYLALRLPQEIRSVVLSDRSGFHTQVVDLANDFGSARAERRGVEWVPVSQMHLDFPIASGESAVKVSYERFATDPFLASTQAGNGTDSGRANDFASAEGNSTQSEAGIDLEGDNFTDLPGGADDVFPGQVPLTPDPVTLPTTMVPVAGVSRLAFRLTVPDRKTVEKTFGPDAEFSTIRVGRDPRSQIVLPLLPSLSADHLIVSQNAGVTSVKNVSSYGTWIEVASEWELLAKGVATEIPAKARLSLDSEHYVILTLSRELVK